MAKMMLATTKFPTPDLGSLWITTSESTLRDGKARNGLGPVSERTDEEERGAPHQKRHAVVGNDRPVDERRQCNRDTHCGRCAERKASSREQWEDDHKDRQDVEPKWAFWSVDALPAEDCAGDTDTGHRQQQSIEPVATRERPQPLHGLKVLRIRVLRLVRENDPNIVRQDDTKSPPRPKTARAGAVAW